MLEVLDDVLDVDLLTSKVIYSSRTHFGDHRVTFFEAGRTAVRRRRLSTFWKSYFFL